MRYAWPLLAAGLLLPPAGIAQARAPQPAYADPADVITADLAFARLAKDKGLAAAMKATAVKDAYVAIIGSDPQPFDSYLHGLISPQTPMKWQLSNALMSCDGSLAATTGDNGAGAYITIWQKQKNDSYKWVLHVEGMRRALDRKIKFTPDMISAQLAECPARGQRIPVLHPRSAPATFPLAPQSGRSSDDTLTWQCNGNRTCGVSIRIDGDMKLVIFVQNEYLPVLAPAHR